MPNIAPRQPLSDVERLRLERDAWRQAARAQNTLLDPYTMSEDRDTARKLVNSARALLLSLGIDPDR
jgi:hypothetical protein